MTLPETIVRCENCCEELHEILFLTETPEESTEAEVICDHCGRSSGTTVADAYNEVNIRAE